MNREKRKERHMGSDRLRQIGSLQGVPPGYDWKPTQILRVENEIMLEALSSVKRLERMQFQIVTQGNRRFFLVILDQHGYVLIKLPSYSSSSVEEVIVSINHFPCTLRVHLAF